MIARLMKRWDAPIYAFFKPILAITYVDDCKAHVFECGASNCRSKTKFIRRYLYTGDAGSTSNLRRHAKICWGEEAVAAADSTRDVHTAREALGKMKLVDSSITAAFKHASKAKVSYSHHQHNTTETR